MSRRFRIVIAGHLSESHRHQAAISCVDNPDNVCNTLIFVHFKKRLSKIYQTNAKTTHLDDFIAVGYSILFTLDFILESV